MTWQQIIFSTTAEIAEPLNELLIETEALAVTMQDAADEPIFEPPLGTTPLWTQTEVMALFAEETDLKPIIAQLQAQLGILPPYRVVQLADQNWERAWMDEFKPMQFGKRLWICPSWCEPPDLAAANLLLDPGLAFGTGTHPTTRLCLEWLDANPPVGQTVIDYGCGSGILGLAALKLAAKAVWAIDNDPQALIATQDNASRNQIDPAQLHTILPDALPTALQVPLLLANILAQPLIELAPKLAALVQPKGTIVLSGILVEQADKVIATYQNWFKMEPATTIEDWVRLVGTRLE